MIWLKYEYFVSYYAGKNIMGSLVVNTKQKIITSKQLIDIKQYIESENDFNDVIILNFKLLKRRLR